MLDEDKDEFVVFILVNLPFYEQCIAAERSKLTLPLDYQEVAKLIKDHKDSLRRDKSMTSDGDEVNDDDGDDRGDGEFGIDDVLMKMNPLAFFKKAKDTAAKVLDFDGVPDIITAHDSKLSLGDSWSNQAPFHMESLEKYKYGIW